MTRNLTIVVIAACLLTACESNEASTNDKATDDTQATVNSKANETTPATAPEDVESDAQKLDASLASKIEFHTGRAEKGSWLDWNKVARFELERARILGVGDHNERAGAALEKAFALVNTPPIDILVTRARLAQTEHRFADARADLEATISQVNGAVGPYQQSLILRGVVAYQAGEFEQAEALWTQAQEISESASIHLLFSDLFAHTGKSELAEKHLKEALDQGRKGEDFGAAWILVQRGLYDLDRGRPAEAKVFYEEANERFSGWYLVEEHLAETQALTGELDKAAALYKSVVDRVPDPELMAAYAGVLREQGKTAEADAMLEKARTALFAAAEEDPAGTSGHGIDLMIEFDPAKAVELAKLDHEARPGPSSAEQYAAALVAAESFDTAWSVLEPWLETAYTSGRYHALVHRIAKERGDAELAEKHGALATAWNPKILEEMFGEEG